MISAPFSGCPYFCTGQVIVSSQKETIGLKIGKGDISMSQRNLKVISIESADKVYHNKNCQYALRMRKKNKTMVTKQEAKQMGYRPCKDSIVLHRGNININTTNKLIFQEEPIIIRGII